MFTEMCHGVFEDVAVDIDVLWLKIKARSCPHSIQTTVRHIDSASFHLCNESIPLSVSASIIVDIKGQTEATTSHIGDPLWVLRCDLIELVPEILSCRVRIVHQLLPKDNLVLLCHQKGAHRVTHPSVEMPVRELGAVLIPVVEAASLGFLGERDEVWGFMQVPMLVSPEFTAASNTCVHFVDDKEHTHLFGQFAELICIETCNMMVTSCRLNWL